MSGHNLGSGGGSQCELSLSQGMEVVRCDATSAGLDHPTVRDDCCRRHTQHGAAELGLERKETVPLGLVVDSIQKLLGLI